VGPAVQNACVPQRLQSSEASSLSHLQAYPAELIAVVAQWRPRLKLNYLTMTFIVALAVVLAINLHRFPLDLTRALGLGIAIPSFVLFLIARIQLGRAFSVKAKATALVTTGLYSRIRNPIYVFGALMVAGAIVFVNQPLFLLIFVVLIPLQVYRSRKEGRVLEDKFGAAYLEYKRQTWF
jgi:protein-S-isoprenylcysteine O-methyltransferase Ste14